MKKIFLIIIILHVSLVSSILNSQYAFNMTPKSGPYGTFVTFTGSGFINGKTMAFLNDKKLKIIYLTRLHLVARIPKGAASGKITIVNAGKRRKFIFPKKFTVIKRKDKIPVKPGIYISSINDDDAYTRIILFSAPKKEAKKIVYKKDGSPVNYRLIQSMASANFGSTNKWLTAFALAKKPYYKNIPETAILVAKNNNNFHGNNNVQKIYGYSKYRNVNTLTTGFFEGDNVQDLIYCVINKEVKKTFLFRKIYSMPRDVELFSVDNKYKINKIASIDFWNNKKAKLVVSFKYKKKWYLRVLSSLKSFKALSHQYIGREEITAVSSGDMDGNGRKELYFATYLNRISKIYVSYLPGNKKLLYKIKGKGKINAISLVDFDKNRRDEIVVSFHKNNTSEVYYSKTVKHLRKTPSILLYKKKNYKVTSITNTMYR